MCSIRQKKILDYTGMDDMLSKLNFSGDVIRVLIFCALEIEKIFVNVLLFFEILARSSVYFLQQKKVF